MLKVIAGMLFGILVAVIAFLAWKAPKAPSSPNLEETKTTSQLGPDPTASVHWRTYNSSVINPNFKFKGQAGWPLYGDDRPNRRVVIKGRFASSQAFVSAAVMSAADYSRVKGGFPPLNITAYLQPGKEFQVIVPPGMGDIVFFQRPPQPDLAQAKSLLQIMVMSAEGLIGAPPAAISLSFRTENQIFGTAKDASSAAAPAEATDPSHIAPAPPIVVPQLAPSEFGAPIKAAPASSP